MVETLRELLAAVVVASLATIALYALVGVFVAMTTLVNAARRDRMGEELDQVLSEILKPPAPEPLAAPPRPQRP